MQALVVVAHPDSDSLCHAAAARAVDGLEREGHTVEVLDLYAIGFRTAMSAEEWTAYESPDPVSDPQVESHIDLLRRSQILVFVYPTWWSSLPAVMKGWLERIMVPGVGFVLDDRTNKVRPGLGHVRRIVGITTWGSPRLYAWLVNDNGRRVLTRALRMSCGFRVRTRWIALYGVDRSTTADRESFLRRVESAMAAL